LFPAVAAAWKSLPGDVVAAVAVVAAEVAVIVAAVVWSELAVVGVGANITCEIAGVKYVRLTASSTGAGAVVPLNVNWLPLDAWAGGSMPDDTDARV